MAYLSLHGRLDFYGKLVDEQSHGSYGTWNVPKSFWMFFLEKSKLSKKHLYLGGMDGLDKFESGEERKSSMSSLWDGWMDGRMKEARI